MRGRSSAGIPTPVSATDILVRYTFYGDADLSGKVDFDTDYHQWQAGFESGGALTGWVWGDFDHNGVIDFDTDYHLWQAAFEAGAGTSLALPTDPGNTPEPGTLVLLTLGAAALLRRRGRK